MARTVFIGIAGPSGAGKTALARRLAERLPAAVLSLDDYYRDLSHLPVRLRSRRNFDRPEAFDDALLESHLEALAAGERVVVPRYAFRTHTRRPRGAELAPAPWVVLEGLFALFWDEIRRWLDLGVFVEAAVQTCLRRRLERDVRERGRDEASVRARFERTVLPMYRRYVEPTRAHADLIVSGEEGLGEAAKAVLARLCPTEGPPATGFRR